MSDGTWFCPLFPPSLQQTGIRVEALRYRGESGMKPCPMGQTLSFQSPREGGRSETHPLMTLESYLWEPCGRSPGRQTGCGGWRQLGSLVQEVGGASRR